MNIKPDDITSGTRDVDPHGRLWAAQGRKGNWDLKKYIISVKKFTINTLIRFISCFIELSLYTINRNLLRHVARQKEKKTKQKNNALRSVETKVAVDSHLNPFFPPSIGGETLFSAFVCLFVCLFFFSRITGQCLKARSLFLKREYKYLVKSS